MDGYSKDDGTNTELMANVVVRKELKNKKKSWLWRIKQKMSRWASDPIVQANIGVNGCSAVACLTAQRASDDASLHAL